MYLQNSQAGPTLRKSKTLQVNCSVHRQACGHRVVWIYVNALFFKTHVLEREFSVDGKFRRGVACFMMVFVVELMATQTGGATVDNIFEVRFTDTKIE